MRTTVELTAAQHRSLLDLAARRGIRGFSPLVREAVDLYLAEQGPERLKEALALEGSLTPEEADEVEARIVEAWSTWPTAS